MIALTMQVRISGVRAFRTVCAIAFRLPLPITWKVRLANMAMRLVRVSLDGRRIGTLRDVGEIVYEDHVGAGP